MPDLRLHQTWTAVQQCIMPLRVHFDTRCNVVSEIFIVSRRSLLWKCFDIFEKLGDNRNYVEYY